MVHKVVYRFNQGCHRECRFHGVRQTVLQKQLSYDYKTPYRKIWDTFSGATLHSFPHNHIVRSVAFSPTASHLLTGGQEKKVRIFDLKRPDAEPEFLCSGGSATAHDGTVKSVVWCDEWNAVSACEDGAVKYVYAIIFEHTL
jgi:WD40 repeat protein